MKVTVVRADYGKYTDAFKKHEFVGIGFIHHELKDTTDKEYLKDEYKKSYPDDKFMTMNINAGQVYRFLNELNIGDIVISPYNDHRLLIGKVKGEPYFVKDDICPYNYRREVEWFDEEINRTEFTIPLQNTLRSSMTVFNVTQIQEILVSVGLAEKGDKEIKKRIDNTEHIYDLIRDSFLKLDSKEFELLVNYVLRSLGFDATQETGKVGDGGIDFEGQLNVMGVASINLQVQVKRYDTSTIGEKEIRNFRGALKKDYQGCFITLSQFNKKAKQSAEDKDRTPIQLIDGRRFIEIFIEQYEKIMDAIYADDIDELARKLKFKKVLLPE